MITLFKGRQRQYKTTAAAGLVLDLVLHGGYTTADIVSNIHLFKPYHGDGYLPVLLPEPTDRASMKLYEHCIRENVIELCDYTYLSNRNMRQYMQHMVQEGFEHKIILIDEIDRVFPPRFWHDREQTEAVLGLWQDEKLFNQIIGTAHLGLSVDNLIRESMQVEVITRFRPYSGKVRCRVLNALKLRKYTKTLNAVSLVQRLFATREAVC